jgi:hypothetical protein
MSTAIFVTYKLRSLFNQAMVCRHQAQRSSENQVVTRFDPLRVERHANFAENLSIFVVQPKGSLAADMSCQIL